MEKPPFALVLHNASHTDLYDGGEHRDRIPFDKIEGFFNTKQK